MFELILIPALLGLGFAIDYIASDEEDEAPLVEVALDQSEVRFDGTDARDHVTGNMLDNVLMGDSGNDLLAGLDGDDTLAGGTGADRIFAGAGNDTGLGGAGNDRLFLGDGNDTSVSQDDTTQDAGDDLIRGGAGNDTLVDANGSDTIFGDIQHDTIITVDRLEANGTVTNPASENNADTVHGGYGNDTLVADAEDVLTGGAGDDSFIIATPMTGAGAPAVITDFDLRDDLLSIVFLEDAPENPDVTFAFDSDENTLRAQVDGQDVVTLSGLAQADIPFITTFVTTLPELMANAA